MNSIEPFSSSIYDMIPEVVVRAYHTIEKWTNRVIALLSPVPDYLQKNPQTALAVLLIANAISFYFINKLAQMLDERVASAPKKLVGDEARFNQILIDGLIVGGSTLIFNIAFARILHYTLDKWVLITITTSAIALKMMMSALSRDEE